MAALLQIQPSMPLAFAVTGNSADWHSACALLTPCILFCRAVFRVVDPQPISLHGFFPPEVQDFAFVELARLLLAQFSSLSRSPWIWHVQGQSGSVGRFSVILRLLFFIKCHGRKRWFPGQALSLTLTGHFQVGDAEGSGKKNQFCLSASKLRGTLCSCDCRGVTRPRGVDTECWTRGFPRLYFKNTSCAKHFLVLQSENIWINPSRDATFGSEEMYTQNEKEWV